MPDLLAHPVGQLVDIVGIKKSSRGRSCEVHSCCGSVLAPDTLVRFKEEEIQVSGGKVEKALCVYWVSEGVDRCLVGFLPRHCLPHAAMYVGRLAQVVDFLLVE